MNDDKKNNKKDLLVTLADANFVEQAKQLFSSAYFNSGWQGDYMLLAGGLSAEDAAWFESKGISVYAPPLLSDFPVGVKSYPPIVLSKLYLFTEYFKQWNRIVFLDADIIVRAPLDRLSRLDGFNAPKIETFWLKDAFAGDRSRLEELRKFCPLRGRPFSTGVMVFNTELIHGNTFKELTELYPKYKDLYQYHDDAILNLYFYKKWKPLPLMYNTIPSEMERLYGLKRDGVMANVIHFPCSPIKPWNPLSPYYEEWLANLKKAEDIDPGNRPAASGVSGAGKAFRYWQYLKYRRLLLITRRLLIIINWPAIDKQIGRLGLFIKKKNRRLYNLISLKNDK